MPSSPTVGNEGMCIMVVCLALRPLATVNTCLSDMISLYIVEGFRLNLAQIFVMQCNGMKRFFKVRSQKVKVMCTNVWWYIGGGIYFDSVVSRLTVLFVIFADKHTSWQQYSTCYAPYAYFQYCQLLCKHYFLNYFADVKILHLALISCLALTLHYHTESQLFTDFTVWKSGSQLVLSFLVGYC